jgi:hypothetical protein
MAVSILGNPPVKTYVSEDVITTTPVTAFARTVLNDNSAAAVRSTIGVSRASEVNIMDFGAVADGVTDCTSALTAAVASVTHPVIYFPPGEYALNITIIKPAVWLRGAGKGITKLYPYLDSDLITISSASVSMQDIKVSDLTLENRTVGSHVQKTNSNGITITGSGINDWHVFDNLYIDGFKTGINITGRTIWTNFKNIRIENSLTNGFSAITSEACNAITLENVHVDNSQYNGFYIEKTVSNTFQDWLFLNCNPEANGLDTTHSKNSGFYCKNVEQFSFINAYVENNGVGAVDTLAYSFRFEGTYAIGIKIEGGYFSGSNGGIIVSSTLSSGVIDNNEIYWETNTRYGITIDSVYSDTMNTKWNITKRNRYSVPSGGLMFNLPVDGSGLYNHMVDGEEPSHWYTTLTSPTSLSLYHSTTYAFSIAADVTFNALIGAIPGQVLTLYNHPGSGHTVDLDSSIVTLGRTLRMYPGDLFELKIDGYPNEGKLMLLSKRYGELIPTLDNSGTPMVIDRDMFLTGGTAAITEMYGGYTGQVLRILSGHSIRITNGTNILLAGAANYDMTPNDTLTLVYKADGKWYELSRSVN